MEAEERPSKIRKLDILRQEGSEMGATEVNEEETSTEAKKALISSAGEGIDQAEVENGISTAQPKKESSEHPINPSFPITPPIVGPQLSKNQLKKRKRQ